MIRTVRIGEATYAPMVNLCVLSARSSKKLRASLPSTGKDAQSPKAFRLHLRTGERLFCMVINLNANDVRYICIR